MPHRPRPSVENGRVFQCCVQASKEAGCFHPHDQTGLDVELARKTHGESWGRANVARKKAKNNDLVG